MEMSPLPHYDDLGPRWRNPALPGLAEEEEVSTAPADGGDLARHYGGTSVQKRARQGKGKRTPCEYT